MTVKNHTPVYLDTEAAVAGFVSSIAPDVRRDDGGGLALDTEGASFHRFTDRIYLLQLSTRNRTAIIDPLPLGSIPDLGALVQDPAVEVVFHDADYDLRLLHQDYGWRVANIFDTRIAAQLLGLKAFGLAALLERYFGVKLNKKHQRADWSLRPLTPGMLDYAALDTMHLLGLRDIMRSELERAGRLGWAEEEFARLEGTRWDEDRADRTDGFLRMKGARDLTRRELAVLREIVAWRDEVAASLDRATFRVIGNEALLEIARRVPGTREALRELKGVPRGILEGRGSDLLAAVARGREVPEDALPRFPRAPRWDRDPDFDARAACLRTVRDEAARRLELDPGVLCSRERLEAIARRKPETLDEIAQVDGMRRWQASELGGDFLAALSPSPYRAG
ncbi:MAG: ribonuclease D [Gemmatimonadaceae bacterium]